MKKNLVLLALLMGICPLVMAQDGEKNFIDQNYIEVTGKAEAEIVPDEIYFKIVLNENDDKGKQSLVQLEKSFLAILGNLNIDVEKSLSVRDASSQFKTKRLKSSDVLTTKTYLLLLNTADQVGSLMQMLDKAGIANVSVDRVGHSQIERFRREVKVNAVKAAKEKAVDLAKAVDQQAGRALYIYEYPSNEVFPVRLASVSNVATEVYDQADGGQEPVVDFEKIKLEYSILARFELK